MNSIILKNTVSPSSNDLAVFFIGAPGSGKSTFWNNHMNKYYRINNDTEKSKSKQKKTFAKAVKDGVGIVLDNNNYSCIQREMWIKLAKKEKYKTIAIRFRVEKDICQKFNQMR